MYIYRYIQKYMFQYRPLAYLYNIHIYIYIYIYIYIFLRWIYRDVILLVLSMVSVG